MVSNKCIVTVKGFGLDDERQDFPFSLKLSWRQKQCKKKSVKRLHRTKTKMHHVHKQCCIKFRGDA